MGVFDFGEEDEATETVCKWKLPSSSSNPTTGPHHQPSHNDNNTKYQFIQQFASGRSGKEGCSSGGHDQVVTIDDDDNESNDNENDDNENNGNENDNNDNALAADVDVSSASLELLQSGVLQQSEAVNVNHEEGFEQNGHVDEDRNCSSPGVEEGDCSSPFEDCPMNGDMDSIVPESPYSDGSEDAEALYDYGRMQESFHSSPLAPVEDSDADAQVQEQFYRACEMDESGTIFLHTDYVTYCDGYFPASLIMISKDSITLKALDSEEEGGAFCADWGIDDIVSVESCWTSVGNTAQVKIQLLNKDVQADNVHGTSGTTTLEFVIHDPNWYQTQALIMSLDNRYRACWSIGMHSNSYDGDAEDNNCSSDPYIPIFEEHFDEVVYPEGDKDAVSISRSDVDLLQPDIFLNDTIIDFYITYLKNEIPPQERHRFHFFSSFFFRKLADPDKNPSGSCDGKAAFQRVRRWTRKVNLFEKDFIFIPVNYNLHWSLLVICHPGEVATFNDENVEESARVPCILHMDSIRGSHSGLKDILQSYLLEEWKERQTETSEDVSLQFLNLRFLSLELPQQENCSDCGLFLLHYAERFIAESPTNFNPFLINENDGFLKPDWFMPADASLKRVHIQRFIYDLVVRHSHSGASPSNQNVHPSEVRESDENDHLEILSENRNQGISWNETLSYPQSVQGMELGLHDMSLYNSESSLRELLECQQYDQGGSISQLGCPMPPIMEEEDDEHVSCSSLGETGPQSIGAVAPGACHDGYSSRDFGGGFRWNSELSDPADLEGNSSPSPNSSSDHSDEMTIIEHGKDEEVSQSCQIRVLDESKHNINSLSESYASASSDMMETPAENSQELGTIYGQIDEGDRVPSNPEEVLEPSSEEPSIDENGGVSAGHDDELVVEEASSEFDEDQDALPSKEDNILRPSPAVHCKNENENGRIVMCHDDTSVVEETSFGSKEDEADLSTNLDNLMQLSPQEPSKKDYGGTVSCLNKRFMLDDSSLDTDEDRAAKRIRLTSSFGEERRPLASLSNELVAPVLLALMALFTHKKLFEFVSFFR